MTTETPNLAKTRHLVSSLDKNTSAATVAAQIAVVEAQLLRESANLDIDGEPYPTDMEDALKHLEAAALALRAAGHIVSKMSQDATRSTT